MKTLKSILLLHLLLTVSVLCAQEVQSFKQHNMKRWGIPAGNYSGIAHISGDRYALISDKQTADGWTEVSISFLPSGDIDRMTFIAHHFDDQTKGKARDSEGIVYVPGQGFFVSAESDQKILELSEDGTPTGKVGCGNANNPCIAHACTASPSSLFLRPATSAAVRLHDGSSSHEPHTQALRFRCAGVACPE